MSDIKKISGFLLILCLGLIMAFSLTSCNGNGEDDNGDVSLEPRYGGVLHMAYGANPSSMDLHKAVDGAALDTACMIAEALFERAADFTIHGDLAKSHTASDDLMVHTITLHEGVKFHDGTELTAEDVIASMERWMAVLPTPPELADAYDSAKAVDRYTVEIHLSQPRGDVEYMLTTYPKILPKSLIDKYGEEFIPNDEVFGSGPYKLREFRSDRYVHLVKFQDYKPRGEEMEGLAGRKNAYLDEVVFHIVPDASVRMMGVESGQYHYGFGVDFWEYERLLDHPTARPIVMVPYQYMRLALNSANTLTNNVKIRQAIQAAIDAEPIMQAGLPSDLYVLTNSKMWIDIEQWATESGKQYYNQANPTLARQLLEEAGYNNEPIKLIGMTDYEHLKNQALIAAKQLEDAGFNVDLLLSDQGTFVARIIDRNEWHIAATIVNIVTTPTSLGWTRDEHNGWWEGETPRKKELGRLLRTETDHAKRFAIWEELHELSYAEAQEVMLGAYFSVSAACKKTFGWMNTPRARWYNVWIVE